MGYESRPVPVCPGVDKVFLQGNSGFVYRMSNDYLRSQSPAAFDAMVDACAGNVGSLSMRPRADMLIIGPGRYERELMQPAGILQDGTHRYRQVHVHGLDLNPIPDDVAVGLTSFIERNPRIQLTHRENQNAASIPALAPYKSYLDRNADDLGALSMAKTKSSRIHAESCLHFPIDTVSIQGMMDYLNPQDLTALLLYATHTLQPSTLILRIAYGEIGRTYMESGDRETFEASIEHAKHIVSTGKYRYIRPIEFMNGIIPLRLMTADDKIKARLDADYPGSHPPVDSLVNLMHSCEAFNGCETSVEEWILPDGDGHESTASVLLTFKHW